MKRNPFKFGPIVAGEYFTDRQTERHKLLSDMMSGQNVTIISPRRYGKSSLISGAMEDMRAEGGLVTYIDVYGITSVQGLIDELTNAVYQGLARYDQWAWREASKVFARIQPHLKVEMRGTEPVAFSLNPGLSAPDLASALQAALALPGEIAAQRKRRVAVVLDEFQAVVDIDEKLPEVIRKVFQRQPDVCHVFAGSRQSLMTKLFFGDEHQPMYNFARRMPLGKIAPELFEAFLRDGFVKTAVGIEPEALVLLLDLTEGHPYQTQELASTAWTMALAAEQPAGPELVREAHEEVLAAEAQRFVEIWDGLSAGARRALAAVAIEPGARATGQDFIRRHDLGGPSSVQRSMDTLLEKGFVERTDPGRYAVPDPYLRLWLRRKTTRLESAAPVTAGIAEVKAKSRLVIDDDIVPRPQARRRGGRKKPT